MIDTPGYMNVLRILHHHLIIRHTQIIGIGPWGLVLAQIFTFAHWAAEYIVLVTGTTLFKALTLAGTFHQLNNTSWGRQDKRGHWSQSFFLLIPSVVFREWDGGSRGSGRLSYYRSQPRSTEMLNDGTSC